MKDIMVSLPIIPLRGMTILPGMLVHFDMNRDITIQAVEDAMASDKNIFITTQKDSEIENPKYEDLYEIGVTAEVKQLVRLSDHVVRVMVASKERATLIAIVKEEPYLVGDIMPFLPMPEQEMGEFTEVEQEAAIRTVRELYQVYASENQSVGKTILEKIQKEQNLGVLLDLIGMYIAIPMEERREVLESFSITKRYEHVIKLLANEVEIGRIKADFKGKVQREVEKNQKDYFLREQMKVIRDELGENTNVDPEEKYMGQLAQLECSQEVKDRVTEEVKRLGSIPATSSENVVARGYIEMLLAMPWDKMGQDNNDLKNAAKILDAEHYGLKKVKERILEFLAVRTLTGKGESPILCLVGPPGTGKTSIAKSVAKALDKKYIRICLGGIRDEAEIRGHRRTYVGAMPGRLADGLKKAKVKNPLILLDEIDKVSGDHRGDTASALLEVLDSEQNSHFVDHYIDLPMDLSEVLFLCTANSVESIPRPLLDRMELIEISGYTQNEKMHIAKEHLISKQIEKNGLQKNQLSVGAKVLEDLVIHYTKEAGVRNLERQIGKICRKTAKLIVEDKETKVRLSAKNIEEFLGKKRFDVNRLNDQDEIGLVRGLAYTTVGGETLEVEVNAMPGSGKLELTGKLGDVMQESAKTALSYVRSLEKEHGKDAEYFAKHDFHLHVPEGAVPKDGPSAGVTMATALFSIISEQKVYANLAMTGEVTLRGRVLPIGGLKEKILAAKNAGISKVLVPHKNKPDVEEMDAEIKEGIQIVYVDHMKDVLRESIRR